MTENLNLVCFNGIGFSTLNLDKLASEILAGGIKSHIHLAAASTVTEASSDSELRNILNGGITLCDSKPLATWLNFRGKRIEQIRGTDLFREVLRKSNFENRHFFLGGTSETLQKLIHKIESDYSSVSIAGFFSPPFGQPSSDAIQSWSEKVQNCGTDILWIGLGSPKQDLVSSQIAMATGKTVIAVGAAFDFLAGTINEAPRYIQALGLEWLYRLFSEPKRLWKRYTIGNMKFIMLLIRDFLARKRS